MTYVYSDTIGLVADYCGRCVVKEEARRYPAFSMLINRWFRDHAPADVDAELVYTSININKNYAGALHRDGNNVGPSFIKAFGDFTGGCLNYYPDDDRSQNLDVLASTVADQALKLDIAKGLLLFDGKRGHWVDDFKGERYTLVYFTCPRFDRATPETMKVLKGAGIPVTT